MMDATLEVSAVRERHEDPDPVPVGPSSCVGNREHVIDIDPEPPDHVLDHGVLKRS
jgi:hypothetical protein